MAIARYLAITFVLFLFPLSSIQARDSLTVIYPDVPSPANRIFQEIISGVEDRFQGDVQLHAIKKSHSPQQTAEWVDQNSPDMLIALGKRGYRIAKRIQKGTPVAIGALPIRPNGISGISLLADPKILFQSLKDLAPQIKVIKVVYSPGSRWLISMASEQAAEMGLDFVHIEVKNIKDAVATYDSMLKSIDPKTEAVWLPIDRVTAHEQVILPNLLEKSWEQNLVLFSSKPAHAKRGALFSMFPDNIELGKRLVDMVVAMHDSKEESGVVPLRNMKLAVNLRTAAHLGFDYKSQQKDSFHLTFPQ